MREADVFVHSPKLCQHTEGGTHTPNRQATRSCASSKVQSLCSWRAFAHICGVWALVFCLLSNEQRIDRANSYYLCTAWYHLCLHTKELQFTIKQLHFQYPESNTHCFVFTVLLGFNELKVKEQFAFFWSLSHVYGTWKVEKAAAMLEAGAYPSCCRARGRIYPGQVANLLWTCLFLVLAPLFSSDHHSR